MNEALLLVAMRIHLSDDMVNRVSRTCAILSDVRGQGYDIGYAEGRRCSTRVDLASLQEYVDAIPLEDYPKRQWSEQPSDDSLEALLD